MSAPAPAPEKDQPIISDALSLLDRAVLEMIMNHRPVARVLETLCLRIEGCSPGLTCSVPLLDHATGALQCGVGPSLPQSYLEAVNGVKIGPRAGSCGTAAYRQQPVVVTDIESDPLWSDYKHLA